MTKKDPRNNNQQLGNLIDRYKKILKPPQQSVIKEVIAVVEEVTSLTIVETQISYTVATKTVHFSVPSLIKTEIKKKQKDVLQKLTERLGEHNSPKLLL